MDIETIYRDWFFSSSKYRYFRKRLSKFREFEIDLDGTMYLHLCFDNVSHESLRNFAQLFDDCSVYECEDEITYTCDEGYLACWWNKKTNKTGVIITNENDNLLEQFCKLKDDDKTFSIFLIETF